MSTDLLETIQNEIGGVLANTDPEPVESAARDIDAAERVFVAGAGRSGFMASAFAMRLVHLGSRVHVVGETTAPTMSSDDVLVAVSGSGSTPGTVRAVEEAGRVGSRVLAVTTDPESKLGALADTVVSIPAATKHRRAGEAASIQPLSSLFDQCTHLIFDAVCLRIAQQREIDNAAAKGAHVTTE
ncbi:6-phospho-3-hexuloisomerase [Parasphingorhabdus pacifica]